MRCNRIMIVFTLFAAVILQLFVYPCLSDLTTDRPVSLERDTAVFPTSLTLIENEAFEGTVFSTLVFQNGLISISEHAFSNTNQLKDAYIPSSAEYISDSAFYNSTIGNAFNRDQYPIDMACKTGTAETGFEDSRKEYSNGLFICYAPYDNPEVALALVVEKGKWGSTSVVIAKKIMAAYFNAQFDSSEPLYSPNPVFGDYLPYVDATAG